jgi:AcrR family transcriptional regulator
MVHDPQDGERDGGERGRGSGGGKGGRHDRGGAPGTPAARRPLTPARIVELALSIIDREGLGALNMRRLAADAGVKPMSLYHHFPSKESILDAVAEAIAAAAVGLPPSEADWRDKVRFLFTGLHLLVRAHPRALPLISTGVIRTPSGRRWMEALMSALLDAGFTAEGAAAVYHALGAYTLGLGYAGLLALDLPAGAIVGELAGHWADYPNLMRVGLRLTAWDRPGEFEAGLDTLLERFARDLADRGHEEAP